MIERANTFRSKIKGRLLLLVIEIGIAFLIIGCGHSNELAQGLYAHKDETVSNQEDRTLLEWPVLADYLPAGIRTKDYIKDDPLGFEKAVEQYVTAQKKWTSSFPFIGDFPDYDMNTKLTLLSQSAGVVLDNECYIPMPSLENGVFPYGTWRIELSQCTPRGFDEMIGCSVFTYPEHDPVFLILCNGNNIEDKQWYYMQERFSSNILDYTLEDFEQTTNDPYAEQIWYYHTGQIHIPSKTIESQIQNEFAEYLLYSIDFAYCPLPALHYCVNYSFCVNTEDFIIFNKLSNREILVHSNQMMAGTYFENK